MKGRLILAAVAAALAAAPPALATPGQVDRAFGERGIATAELGPHYEETSFEAISPLGDGAVLATREKTIQRFLANGSLDTGFTPQTAPEQKNESRAQLPSGKTLVATEDIYAYGKFAMAEIGVRRLNSDGSPDTGYGGGDGLARLHTDFGFNDSAPKGIVATSGEGAVVIGSTGLIALSADGALDKGYGAGGSVTVGGNVVAFDQLADGRLEIAGYTACSGTPSDLFVNRYTAGGAPDQGYGDGGRATADFGASEYAASALWSDDGSVLLGGVRMEASEPSPTAFCVGYPVCTETPVLARFDANGHLDPGFGQGGLLRFDSLSGSSKRRLSSLGLERLGVAALSPRPAGGYFASGSGGPGETFAFIAALTPSGSLDQSFGSGGIVTERSPKPSSQRAQTLAVGRDGSIYLGGSTDAGVGAGPGVFRFRPDGTLDSGYGEAGFGGLDEGAGVTAMALDRSGRATLLTGQRQLSRLTADGDVDRSFGVDGRVAPTPGALYALAALPGGGLVGAGSWTPRRPPRDRMLAVRMRPDGSPDKRFGQGGHAGIACPGEACVAYEVGVDRAGRIVLAGVSDNRMAIARLLPDGRRDRGFGDDGLVFPPVGTGSLATALTLRPDGIYVAGLGHFPDRNEQVLIHYRDDGRLDRGFGHRGVIHIPTNRRVNPVAILPSHERVVMVTAADRRSVFAYARDGRLDRSFGRGAKLAPLRTGPTLAALQRGRLLLGWTRPLAGQLEQVALQRLRSR
jgi:uncharacterized delta-60 repeat protein